MTNTNLHGEFGNMDNLRAAKLRLNMENEVKLNRNEIKNRNLQIASLIIMIAAGLALSLYDPMIGFNMVAFSYL